MLLKFTAFFMTDSNAILTDAAESIVNVVASVFAFYSIYLSSQPKDDNHPYGHGKVEFFSAFVEGVLITLAGLVIVGKSVYNLYFPSHINDLLWGTLIVGIAGLVNAILGLYLINTGRKTQSIALVAEGKHLLSDTYSSIALVIGLIIIQFTQILWLDSALAILVGLYIIYTGYKIVRRSVGGLMDESDEPLVEEIVSVLQQNREDAWIDVHNFRTQQYGPELHVDCHVTLPYYFDLNEVHTHISAIDALVNTKVKRKTEFFIHADPCLPECCHYCHMPQCPVRQQEFEAEIVWTPEIVVKNKKHFSA